MFYKSDNFILHTNRIFWKPATDKTGSPVQPFIPVANVLLMACKLTLNNPFFVSSLRLVNLRRPMDISHMTIQTVHKHKVSSNHVQHAQALGVCSSIQSKPFIAGFATMGPTIHRENYWHQVKMQAFAWFIQANAAPIHLSMEEHTHDNRNLCLLIHWMGDWVFVAVANENRAVLVNWIQLMRVMNREWFFPNSIQH